MGKLVGTANLIRSQGLPVEIVSGGGTGTHDISGRIPGVTEIQGGSYLLMDTDYQTDMPSVRPGAQRAGNGNQQERQRTPDSQHRPEGNQWRARTPRLERHQQRARLRKLNAEHAIVDILDPSLSAQVGDQLELWAHYSDATVNLHRRMFGMRNGQVEETFLFES